ncbi:MAG: phospholipid carrier-dependent glycosyltransferase [Elusimicrobia bacterium]|nr:phospholipid carrier-dependent glycosyltransferase [Elusimicrobiota bacterium]
MVRCLLAIFIPLGADEAYYYVYTLNPSLSYFDLPPMVALVGSVIPFLTGIASPFALRLLPLILFSLTLFVFYKFCLLYMEEKKALFATGVFGAIPMFFISGSALMPDSPLIFFWVLSLYLFKKNIDNPTNKG